MKQYLTVILPLLITIVIGWSMMVFALFHGIDELMKVIGG